MRRRHIAIIAPPWYALPPSGYGGVELVVALLVRALRRRNVDITVYGAECSDPGTTMLASRSWTADLGGLYQCVRESTYITRVVKDLKRLGRVDLIHDHGGWPHLAVMSQFDLAPVVHTVHGVIEEPEMAMYREVERSVGLIAISDDQRASASSLHWAGRVHNAVDVDALQVATHRDKESYLLYLSRIKPEKGNHLAIEVARRTGRRLVLAGKVGELASQQRYFKEKIEPYIDGDQVVYVQNVAGVAKARLLANASALIAPLLWAEPFGLTMAEAMTSGTPVIALARGAAGELVVEGETGFLRTDVDGMVEAVGRLGEIDPQGCARHARRRFSPDAMADRYLQLYENAVRSDTSVTLVGAPITRVPITPYDRSGVIDDPTLPSPTVVRT